jgi:DNA-binding MurR/RpiR family transcriptional regulator
MQGATSYEALKDAIAEAYPEMSAQLQRIARFVLERPHDLALGTVATVAAATEVQPSAMIRFANALGYRGFSDMQQVFRGHLVERAASYRERIQLLRRNPSRGERTPSAVLHQLVGESMAELGRLDENVREADLLAAVKLLAGAGRIHVLAQRRAYPVACYLAYALGQLELKTHLLDGAGGMLGDSLRSVDSTDVLVVASFRNYSVEVVEAAQACSRRGIPVIAITDGPLSPLSGAARVCFELADAASGPFRSLAAPLCLAQGLVMSTGHYLAEKAGSRAASRPARRRPAGRGQG